MKKLPEAVSIFIMPPSPQILEMRLRHRTVAEEAASKAAIPEAVIQQRLAAARNELKQMPDYKKTIETFQGHGFELSGMFSVTDECFPTLLEFDCVMVNSRR